MNYIVLVHIISIQTKQNETSNNQGASLRIKKTKICTSRKKTFTVHWIFSTTKCVKYTLILVLLLHIRVKLVSLRRKVQILTWPYLFQTRRQSAASIVYVIFLIPSHSLGTWYTNSTGLFLRSGRASNHCCCTCIANK